MIVFAMNKLDKKLYKHLNENLVMILNSMQKRPKRHWKAYLFNIQSFEPSRYHNYEVFSKCESGTVAKERF